MMKYIVLFLALTYNTAFCSDSLKVKQQKNCIDLSYGSAIFFGERDLLYQIRLYSYDEFTSTPLKTAAINYSRLLNQKKNGLYLNSGISYSWYDITITKNHIRGHSSDPIIHKIRAVGLSLQLEHICYLKNLNITQGLGINYTKFIQDKTIQYEETVVSSYPYSDSSLISPSNPGGWTWNNSTTVATVTTNVEQYENYFTPIYNIAFGYSINSAIPFVRAEISLFHRDIKSPILKYQAGIKFLF